MKKIIILIAGCLLFAASNAQKGANQKPNKAEVTDTSAYDPKTDSIPPMSQTELFINNSDLSEFLRILKLVMSDEVYKKAGDPISQYQLIIENTNQVFQEAAKRWALAHRIKKPVK